MAKRCEAIRVRTRFVLGVFPVEDQILGSTAQGDIESINGTLKGWSPTPRATPSTVATDLKPYLQRPLTIFAWLDRFPTILVRLARAHASLSAFAVICLAMCIDAARSWRARNTAFFAKKPACGRMHTRRFLLESVRPSIKYNRQAFSDYLEITIRGNASLKNIGEGGREDKQFREMERARKSGPLGFGCS